MPARLVTVSVEIKGNLMSALAGADSDSGGMQSVHSKTHTVRHAHSDMHTQHWLLRATGVWDQQSQELEAARDSLSHVFNTHSSPS